MTQYRVTLIAASGERLTLFENAPARSTPAEHAVCEIARDRADREHPKLAPWEVAASRCESV